MTPGPRSNFLAPRLLAVALACLGAGLADGGVEQVELAAPSRLDLSELAPGRLYEVESSGNLAGWRSVDGLFSPATPTQGVDLPEFASPSFFRLVSHTGAANWTTPTQCAEEDNVNIPLSSLGSEAEIIATHPQYAFTTDNCAADFTNCSIGPGSDFSFTPLGNPNYYDDGTDIVGVVREEFFWRPQGMTVTLDGGSAIPDIHFLTLSRKIPDEASWPQYLVLYADGNLRLIPFPPAGIPSVCFGTSVIAGPAAGAARPLAEIAVVDYDSSARELDVTYRDGGTAVIDVLEVSRQQARVRLALDHTPHFPIVTFRSMYVADGNADADSIRWIDHEGTTHEEPLGAFTAGTGSDWQLFRAMVSGHNTSAPDIRIVLAD